MLKRFLNALVPTVPALATFTGLMVGDQVVGRVTIGKPLTRGLADGIVRMAGGNRNLLGQ